MLQSFRRGLSVLLAFCVSAATFMVAAPVVYAADPILVTQTGDRNGTCSPLPTGCSLREAITKANTTPGPDTIIVPAGTYTLTLTDPVNAEGSNSLDNSINDLDITESVTIIGSGGNREGSPSATVIKMTNGYGRVVTVRTDGGTVSLEALQIQDGYAGPTNSGGGILFRPGTGTNTYTLYNSIVTGNVAGADGGGINIGTPSVGNTGNLVIIEKSAISGNHAGSTAPGTASSGGGLGGGINVGAEVALQVRDSLISNNVSRGGTCNPSNCLLSSGDGGGIHWWDDLGTPVAASYVQNSIISGNQALDSNNIFARGGGWYAGRPLKVTNTTVTGNHANFDGGGLYHSAVNGDYHYLANVTISGNTANNDGAGLILTPSVGAQLYVVNTTVTNNRANADGVGGGVGAGLKINGLDPEVRLHNSIVGGNFKGTGTTASDIEGDNLHSTSSYNVIGTGGGVNLVNNVNNNKVGLATAQLGLAPLANNGAVVAAAHVGVRQTHALLGGSAALDAGNNTYVDNATYGGPYTTDGRGTGWSRKLDAGDADTTDTVDAGALEMHPAIFDMANQSVIQDPPSPLVIPFYVGDADVGFTSVNPSVSGESTPGLVASVTVGGSGHNRTLTIAPGAGKHGTATITTTVTHTYNGTLQSMSDTFVLTVVPRPDLSVTKAPVGTFRQGDQNKSYTITVSNAAGTGTSLQPGDPLLPSVTDITVVDTLPTGLTYDSFTGTGWSCNNAGQVVTCTYDPSLSPGSSVNLSLLVDVADDAGTPVLNTVTVSGGGDNTPGNNTATHSTPIIQTADLTIAKSHTDPWKQGETGKEYTLTVTNIGPGPTDAPYTVTDTLPAGLTPTGAGGTGWTCTVTGQNVSCTRSTVLPNTAGSNSTTITIPVSIARDATTPKVNTANVSGGGELASRSGNNSGTDSTPIVQMPDLTLVKTAHTVFRQGGTGTYRIVVTNSGFADTAGTVTVTDTLPAGLTPTGGSGTGWACQPVVGQTITCSTDVVKAAGQSFDYLDLTVAVGSTTGTPQLNTATASGGGEIWTANSDGSVSTTIIPAPDLTLDKQAAGTFAQAGTGQYTVVVTNSGGGPTDGTLVRVTDTLPAGLTPTAASGGVSWACTVTGQDVTCDSTAVVNGGQPFPTITIDVTIAPTADPSLDNTAAVTGGGETVTNNNSDTVTTAITQRPDVTIALSHSDPFHQGQANATYTVTVTNDGSASPTGGATVTSTLPAGLTPTAAAGTGWNCQAITGQDISCSVADLAPGATSAPLTITVTVAGNATDTSVTAAVTAANDRNTGNNSDTDATTVTPKPDLTLTKSAVGTFREGQAAQYKLVVRNSGFAATTGTVTVTDTLPAGLSPAGFSGTGWGCTDNGTTFTCTTTASAAAGTDFADLFLDVQVADDAPVSVDNSAAVSGGGEAVTSNNTAQVTTTVAQAADLTVTKSLNGTLAQGEPGEYQIVVRNSGDGATDGSTPVTMSDVLNANLSFVSATGSGWTCAYDSGTRTVSCDTTAVVNANTNFATITLTVGVANNAPTTLANTASVSGGGEVNTGNNSSTATNAVEQKADLVIAKSHTGNFHQSQTGATYTITVTNQGFGVTSGTVTVTDTLPAGLEPKTATGTGWNCDITGQLVECTTDLAKGQNEAYASILIAVDVAADATDTTNTAAVSVSNDVDTSNNSDDDATTVEPKPDLTLTKTAVGTFREGQAARYKLVVHNGGHTATTGTVTVTDTLPAGLSPAGFSGTGWGCTDNGTTFTCTTTASAAAGANFADLFLDVQVADDAPLSVDNSAAVSGGGEVVTTNNGAQVTTTIVQAPDLTITKSAATTFRQGKADAQFTITVRNDGEGPTDGTTPITVTDVLHSDLSFVSATGSGWACTYNSGTRTVTCATSAVVTATTDFPSITLTVGVATAAEEALSNTATVAGGGEIVTTNNSATANVTVEQVPDLRVAKSHSDPFREGQVGATYTLTVTNHGTGLTTGTVTVTDTLPAGLSATAVAGDGWNCTLATLTCDRSDRLAAGVSYADIVITVTVADDADPQVTNTAAVSGGNDQVPGNNSASDTTNITQVADLTVTKSHTGDFRQGQAGASYTLRVTNNGDADTVGTVTLTDTVPAGLTPTAFTTTDWSCSIGGQVLSCSNDNVLPAGNAYPDVQLTVSVSATAPASLTNTATVAGGGEVVTSNNSASDATTIVQVANLTLAKSHSGDFRQGSTGSYTLTVSNTGTGPTDEPVTVTDTLPAGLTPGAATGTGWACTTDLQIVECTRSDVLAAGGVYPDLTLPVTVAPNAAAALVNEATVSGGGEAITTDNMASDSTTVVQVADLTVTKTHHGNMVKGHTGTYTITVRNTGAGPTDAAVSVTDTLPAPLTATEMSGTGWTCDLPTLTCTRADVLAAGGSYPPILLKVSVPANAADALVTNSVTVTGGGQAVLTNDTATDDTRIVPPQPDVPPVWVTISAPVTLTRASTIVVSGAAPGSAIVTVDGVGITADATGNWSMSVALPEEGPNTITATVSTASASVTVVRDTTPPQLTLSADEMVTDSPTVRIQAESEEGATIEINGTPGNSRVIQLELGANVVTAKATDRAGNTAAGSITVVRIPKKIERVSLQVTPGQPVDWIDENLRLLIPANAAPGQLLLVLQSPGETPSLGSASLLAVVEITMTGQGERPVRNLGANAELRFSLDPAQTADPSQLFFFWYDPEGQTWVALPTTYNEEGNYLAGVTDHLSIFGLLAPADPVPVLDAVPPVTGVAAVTLTGTAKPGATVTAVVNGTDQGSATVNGVGRFTLTATVAAGENRIYVRHGEIGSEQVKVSYEAPRPPKPKLKDVDGHWAAAAITRMVDLEVVRGYEDTTFRPENKVTRAELAVIMARMLKLELTDEPLPFPDAAQIPTWAAREIAAAVEAGLLTTRADGSFDANTAATRAEIAFMLRATLALKGKDTAPGTMTFKDEDSMPAPVLADVKAAARYGLLNGFPDGTFRAGNTTTRAEVVTVLGRLLDLQ